jgi:hypothetical protein
MGTTQCHDVHLTRGLVLVDDRLGRRMAFSAITHAVATPFLGDSLFILTEIVESRPSRRGDSHGTGDRRL